MSPHYSPQIRLHLLVAKAAPRIVILRRGPSRVYHVLAWNTETDEIEHGSWFRGHLYVRRCDLSWDGEWLVYFALGPTREHYAWTALSRPPWVKAEVFWPQDNTWNGGGIFTHADRLWLNIEPEIKHRAGEYLPPRLKVTQRINVRGEDMEPFYARLERDGWRAAGPWPEDGEQRTREGLVFQGDPGYYLQPTPAHPALRVFFRGFASARGYLFEYLLDGYPDLLDTNVEWAGWDHAHRLVLAREGVIERYTLQDLGRGDPSFRCDLRDLQPPERPPRGEPREPAPALQSRGGPDAAGRYHYLGDPARTEAAVVGPGGQVVTSPADLHGIGHAQPEASLLPFVVTQTREFVLGGAGATHGELAIGLPVLAAGYVLLGRPGARDIPWIIAEITNRSEDYEPLPESFRAVAHALDTARVEYPRAGYTEVVDYVVE